MKLNFDRWRGLLRGLLACGVLTVGAFAVRAQDGQELPSREQLERELAQAEDPESQQASWLQEALDNLAKREAAAQRIQDSKDYAASAPAREAELSAQLTAKLPELNLEVDPALSVKEVRAQAEAYARAAQDAKSKDDEKKSLLDSVQEQLTELPSEVSDAQDALEAAQEARIALLAADVVGSELDAALTRAAWRQAEVDALQARRPELEAKRTVLSLEQEVTERDLERALEVSEAWQTRAEELRKQVDAQEAQNLRDTVAALIAKHPELESFREPFDTLAELRSGERSVLTRSTKENEELAAKRDELEEVTKRFASARERQSIAGTTELLGLVLRRDYESLPRPAALRAQMRKVEQQQIAAEIDRLDLQEKEYQLKEEGLDPRVIFGDEPSDAERDALRQIASLELKTINELRDDLGVLITAFSDHRRELRELEQESSAYRDFIERRILWVRSTDFAPWQMVSGAPGSAVRASKTLAADIAEGDWVRRGNNRMSTLLFGSLGALVLFALRRVLLRKREEFGGLVRSYRTDRFILSIRATVQTVLLALPLPLVTWTLGTGLLSAPTEMVRAAGEGLREAAWVWWTLRTAKGLCAPKGLGIAHFRWPGLGVRALERELLWFTPLTVSLTWVFVTLSRQSNSDWSDSLGRCAFIVAMLALSLFGRRLLHERSSLWVAEGASLLGRGRSAWFALATLMPTALALAAFSGFYYTALEFELRLRWSLGFGFVLLLLNSLLSRWLFHSRRKLAVRQAMEARAQREREAEAGSEEAQEAARMAFDAERVDIPDVDAKTRQLFRTSLTLASVIGLYLLWASALPALRGLDRVQVWPNFQVVETGVEAPLSIARIEAEAAARDSDAGDAEASQDSGSSRPLLTPMVPLPSPAAGLVEDDSSGLGLDTQVTLADVLLALLFGLLTAVFSKNLPALLELAILQRLPLESGARYAIATIARYLILIVGISATTSALGIGWQKVQWLAAALTFGLAFGLQEIFANFVSGLILLLERPIRVGDIVTVGGTEGRVTQLRMRATTIQDWNRRELLVPNKEFITGSVVNWTLTDPVTRVVIPVGIAYGSDVGLARKLLLDVAKKNDLVLDDPKPQALFLSFGASSLDFQLRVFISNRDVWPDLMDGLHSSIDAAFRRANIEISFPQRDLHLRSVDAGVVDLLGGKDASPAAD
jgi:potassium efflux system protein